MKIYFLPAAVMAIFFVYSCGDQSALPADTASKDTIAEIDSSTHIRILDPEGSTLIDSNAKVENLGGGFTWTEGPLYIADGDYLLFSDIPANKVMKWKEGEGVTTFLDHSGFTSTTLPKPDKEPGSNGLLLDKKGNLVLCQHGDRRLARMNAPLTAPKADYTTIADKYRGKRFNSPNDAVYRDNGDLYITDPPYGLEKGNDDTAKEIKGHGVYRITPAGKVDLLTDEYDYPNGICFTPDQKFLLVGHSSDKGIWMKYELSDKGLVKNKSVFYQLTDADKDKPGAPDGMKMNKKGYLFASGPGGIWVFNPSSKPVARIYTGQATSNCAFSADEKTLFMTCDDFLYRVKLK